MRISGGPPRKRLAGASCELPATEEPAFQGLEQLAAGERPEVLGAAVPFGNAEIVLETVVGRRKSVVELEALEHIVVAPGLVRRTVLRIDRPPDRPQRALLALDPDHDGLLDARVVDPMNHALGEAALRGLPPHGPKDTIVLMQRLASLLRSPFSFLFARSSTEERVAAYVIREHGRGRGLGEILEDRYVQNRLSPQQRLRLLDRPELIQALGDETVEDTRRELESARI
jgi:hypothetical protein